MKTCSYCPESPVAATMLPPHPSFLICGNHGGCYKPEAISRYFYRCRYCGELELKEKWGAGRITCPSCGKLAPSAEESKHMAMCPVCGGPSRNGHGEDQLLCESCSAERWRLSDLGQLAPPMPFLGFTFCDQPCQSFHKTGEHLL